MISSDDILLLFNESICYYYVLITHSIYINSVDLIVSICNHMIGNCCFDVNFITAVLRGLVQIT